MIPTLAIGQLGRGGKRPVVTGWAYINSAGNLDTTSGTSLALPATSLTAGNHIFVYVRWENSSTTVSVSDTAGNTYTGLTATNTSDGCYGRWFYCLNASGNASNVVTVAWSSARTFRWIGSLQFSCTTSPAYDTETSGSGASSTSVTSSAFNTAGAGLILAGRGVFNQQSSTTFSDSMPMPLSGFSTNGNSTTHYGNVGYLLTTAAQSSKTITETGNSSTNRCLQIACFN